MKQEVYDVIVVGSGITGGWAAKEFCEMGLKVLLLERGKNLEHPDYPGTSLDPWAFPHRGRLTKADRQKHHIQVRHFSIHEENKHFFVNDVENPYIESARYDWIRADVLGGRSILWGRHCYRWSDLDFEANARDGIAVDWPIRYRDIAPWYDYVERFVGISGAAENIPHLPDGVFLPPMEFNCVEREFKKNVEKRFPGRKVIIGRVANLTASSGSGRGRCQFRNRCDRGCPYGAYFSTNAGTLPAALATGNLTVLTDTLANRVIYDEQKGRASGVEVVNTKTNEVRTFHARVVFLNASTLGTTFILLNSTSNRFPNGLGNGSDQVGRNLMDHHKGSGATARVEGFEDKYYYGQRPNQIYLPRFRNIAEKRSDFIRGYGMQGGGGRAGWSHASSLGIGESLKAAAMQPGPWHFSLQGYGECLPHPENRVVLNRTKTDKWGRPVLDINCRFRENETEMNKDMSAAGAEMLEAAGFRDVKPYSSMSFPGNANHEMGTARMGRDPKTSVLNSFNQMHEVPNVFITDGSFMTSSSCVNPSLTYMAMTARACHYAASEMKKLNL
ncbi:MAG TPA: GMC family oxidoreductase [Cyclobacteriaceae bacterium]|nr:GMC family oxidoreductase [Cyclobacteriaceae bacterium]